MRGSGAFLHPDRRSATKKLSAPALEGCCRRMSASRLGVSLDAGARQDEVDAGLVGSFKHAPTMT